MPITGIAGDQQAALFGQGCLTPGMAKNTYGTGCFLLMNTGSKALQSQQHLLATIAWRLGSGPLQYALEGSVFVGGAAVQWLRDGLGLIRDSGAVEALAQQVTGYRGGVLRARLHGPGCAPLGSAGARRAAGPDARHHRGAYRARDTGGDRLSEHRCAQCHAGRLRSTP